MCAANEWKERNTPEEPNDLARLDGYARDFAEGCRAGEKTPYVTVCDPVTVVYFHSDDDEATAEKFQRQWTARLQPGSEEGVSTFDDAGANGADRIRLACESFDRRYPAANPLLRLFVVLDPGCEWKTILGGVEDAARAILSRERRADILLCMRVAPGQSGSGECLKTAVQLKEKLEAGQQRVHLYCFAFGRGIEDPNGRRKTSELKAILDTAMLICADKSKLRGEQIIQAYSDSPNAKLQAVGSLRVDAQLEAAYKVAFDAFSDACIDCFLHGNTSLQMSETTDDTPPLRAFLEEAQEACFKYVDRLVGRVQYLTHQPYEKTMITQDHQTTKAFDSYYYAGLMESFFTINLAKSGIPKPEDRLTKEKLTEYLYHRIDHVGLIKAMDWIRKEMQEINETYPEPRAADGFKPADPEKTALQFYAAQHMADVHRQAIGQYADLLRDCLDMFQAIKQKLTETKVATQNSKTGMTHFVYYTTLENQIKKYLGTNPYTICDIRARFCNDNTTQSYLEIIHGLFKENQIIKEMIPTDISFLKENNENIGSIQEKIKQRLEQHRRVRIQKSNSEDIATTYAITHDPDSFIELFKQMGIRNGARAGITEPYLTLVKIWEIEDPEDIILDKEENGED